MPLVALICSINRTSTPRLVEWKRFEKVAAQIQRETAPDQPVGELPILAAPERAELLTAWNAMFTRSVIRNLLSSVRSN